VSGNNEASLLLRIKQAGGEVLDHFVVTLGDVYEAVKKVTEFLYSFVEAYKEQEEATNKLSQAMVNQGMYSTELRKKYEEQADSLQKVTKFSDESIISAQAVLQAAVGQKEVSEKLTKATLDLAAAKGIDLASAAEIMAKAVGHSTQMLQRYGIQAEDSSNKNTRLENTIAAVEQKFGGQAEKMAEGLGSIEVMKNAFNDFQETIGKRLAPAVELASKWLTVFFQGAKDGSPVLEELIDAVNFCADQAIQFVRDFKVVGTVVGDVLGGIAATVNSILEGQWKEAWKNAKGIVQVTSDDVTKINEDMNKQLTEMDAAFVQGKQENLSKEEALIKASNDRKGQANTDFNLQEAQKELELQQHRQDARIMEEQMEEQSGANKIASQVKMLDKQIQDAESYQQKKLLVQQRGALIEAQRTAMINEQKLKVENMFQTARSGIIGGASELITAIAGNESKAVFLIQKAAAIAQAVIATNQAAVMALASPPGPPTTIPLANMAEIQGYMKVGAIAATAIKGLATGGIVPATNGGTPFIIGEGGRDEAVIPLDDPDARSRLGGGSATIIFQGPIMADEAQAEKFARVIDRALLKLKQSNQSVAFESEF
jgi:hypothetical protein